MGIDSHLRSSVVLGKRSFVENEILKEARMELTVKGSDASPNPTKLVHNFYSFC